MKTKNTFLYIFQVANISKYIRTMFNCLFLIFEKYFLFEKNKSKKILIKVNRKKSI